MADGGLLIPTANRSTYQAGTKNNFGGIYSNQCTWWAAERYHQLTGIWVPWNGNANQWAVGAQNANWQVQNTPPKGIPSIICLQGYAGQGLAGAGLTYGHVGVVESINSDGSVQTSDFNWYPHIGDSQVVYVRFTIGNGVSFLYASNNAVSSGANTLLGAITGFATQVSLTPDASVTQFLVDMDRVMQISNPFTPPDVKQDTVAGVTFDDPIDYLEKVAGALWGDTVAIVWRIVFLLLGFFLLYKVLSHFVDFAGIAQQTGSTVSKMLPMLGA